MTDLFESRLRGRRHYQVIVVTIDAGLNLVRGPHKTQVDVIGPSKIASTRKAEVGVTQGDLSSNRGGITPDRIRVARPEPRVKLSKISLAIERLYQRNEVSNITGVGGQVLRGNRELQLGGISKEQCQRNKLCKILAGITGDAVCSIKGLELRLHRSFPLCQVVTNILPRVISRPDPKPRVVASHVQRRHDGKHLLA